MKKEIRRLSESEMTGALDLAWDVFSEFTAELCTEEGIEEFWKSTDCEYMISRMGDGECRAWGAFSDGRLCGMCVMREPCRVEMLFVEGPSQRHHIGSLLLKKAVMDEKKTDDTLMKVTVNSFKSAVGFFEKMGFAPAGEESDEDGIPVLPMEAHGKIEIIRP